MNKVTLCALGIAGFLVGTIVALQLFTWGLTLAGATVTFGQVVLTYTVLASVSGLVTAIVIAIAQWRRSWQG